MILHCYDCTPTEGTLSGRKLQIQAGYNPKEKWWDVSVYGYDDDGDHPVAPPLWKAPVGQSLVASGDFIRGVYRAHLPPIFWDTVRVTGDYEGGGDRGIDHRVCWNQLSPNFFNAHPVATKEG